MMNKLNPPSNMNLQITEHEIARLEAEFMNKMGGE